MANLPLSIGIYLLLLFDKFAISFTHCHKSETPRLLLLRTDNIGDFVLWTESASHYQKLYPNYKITLLTQDSVAPLAKKLPYWCEVWGINSKKFRRNPIYRCHLLRKIANAGFEIAIQPTFSRHFTIGDSIIRGTKAKVKIGSVGNCDLIPPWLKCLSDNWYTKLIPATQKPLMELRRHAEFLNGLGKNKFQAAPPILPVLTQLKNELSIKHPYFIIFPGASWSGRQWPIHYFANLMLKLHKLTGWLGVICGNSGDNILSAKLLPLTSYLPLNLTGKTSLPELVEIIRNSQILIGNETSAIHLAAATSTKSVCILGGGHYGRFLPYDLDKIHDRFLAPIPVINKKECFGCNWQCKYPIKNKGPARCINDISVKDVFNAVLKSLEIEQQDTCQN